MEQTQPAFTIVLPVHNGGDYLAEALDSVFAQTYPHYDIAILENCSTDNTLAIIARYDADRIRVIASDTLLGIEANWARMPSIAANEYMVLMCADDILYPGFLEAIAALIEQEPDATLYHSHAYFIDERSQIVDQVHQATYKETAADFIHAVHTFREDAFGTGYVMRFADYQKVGGYPPFRRLLFADFYCYYSLTKLGYKACVQTPLSAFRRNSAGVTGASAIDDFVTAAGQYREALLADPDFDDRAAMEDFIQQMLMVQYRRHLINRIKHSGGHAMQPLAPETADYLAEYQPKRAFPHDFPLTWYRALSRVPLRPVRLALLYAMLFIVQLRAPKGHDG
jgi:glycosyltransferase involved in cell wall biosynthesis